MLCPFALADGVVALEPLTTDHVAGLAAAAAEDRQTYGFTLVPDGPEATLRYVESALQQREGGQSVPFVVRSLTDGRVVGTTRYLDMEVFVWPPPWPPGAAPVPVPDDDRPPSVLEIGSTWYAASVQRTPVNTRAKLLLLAHAFDAWGVLRVTLKTDARNERSRTAIQRLGASFEGLRRAHMPATDGTVRDTAYYSITATEWPAARLLLEHRLAEQQPGSGTR